jgi:hypothetical protein
MSPRKVFWYTTQAYMDRLGNTCNWSARISRSYISVSFSVFLVRLIPFTRVGFGKIRPTFFGVHNVSSSLSSKTMQFYYVALLSEFSLEFVTTHKPLPFVSCPPSCCPKIASKMNSSQPQTLNPTPLNLSSSSSRSLTPQNV